MIHKSQFGSRHYLVLFSLLSHLSATAIITVPLPVSVTVPPLTTATFTCEGTGDILNWLVESDLLTDSIAQQRQISVTTTNIGDTNFSSVLTVNAIPGNDDLGIGCEVITFIPFDRVISSSTLTIRGVSSVENLRYNFTSNNLLLISWEPPSYHSTDILHGSSVIYQILVTADEGNIILNITIPDTNTEVVNITQCDTFDINVTALMGQYTSTDTDSNNGSYSITRYDIQPLIPSISFKLGCPPSKCLVSLMDGNTEVTDIITETEHMIEFKLSPFRHYKLTAVVKNLRGKTRAVYNTSISTFDTQNIIINSPYTNGSVSVQCVFVSGATADGCHVIFTDTSNGRNEYFNITGQTLVPLPAGNYTVTAYDIINGALHGPAVYPTSVEIIKIIPSISSSSTHDSMSPTASSEVILTPTSSTTIGTETTSSTSETINDANNVVLIVAGTVSGIVPVILIISAVCVGVTVYKRKRMMKVQVLIRSDIAIIQKPQAETNPYQDAQELRNEVSITTSPVQLTYNRPIDEENPYHVTRSEFLPDSHHTIPSHIKGQLMPQSLLLRPSLTSTTTQETTLEGSISSTTSNNIHDNAYTTETPTCTATDTITVTVDDTNTTVPDNEATNNTPAAIATVSDTAATVAPTYAVIGKRTDTTVPPAVDQCVTYDTVTGDINKRGGGITVYQQSDDISPIPPPSYADTIDTAAAMATVNGTSVDNFYSIDQRCSNSSSTVSTSQFVVPNANANGAAVVHGQCDELRTTDACRAPNESPIPHISPVHFTEIPSTACVTKFPLLDNECIIEMNTFNIEEKQRALTSADITLKTGVIICREKEITSQLI